ncbi:histidine phosphatase family protein [Solibacillus sp. CAU 1738]|uniref:histidine phosphatase family protein n=1 Tax=Solibacillus sp. CAU 1738 TaxID=3140363 RepID=UPI0032613EE4
MTTIYLIRHGETDWNTAGKVQGLTDIPLNINGEQQAQKSSMYFENKAIDVILCSPLLRARRTAEIINAQLGIQLIEMQEFAERCYGDAEGLTIDERTAKFGSGIIPNLESREDLQNRVIKGMNQIVNEFENQKILVVAHGAVINAILYILSKGEIGSGITRLKNACISCIGYKNNSWDIISVNEDAHLQ